MDAAEKTELDLSQFDMADWATLKIRNQAGDDDFIVNGEPVLVEVWSPGSKAGQAALHRAGLLQAARMRRVARAGGKVNKTETEMAEQEQVDKLVGFTKSFSPNFAVDPEKVYSRPKMRWFTRQVEEYIDQDSNFPAASSKS